MDPPNNPITFSADLDLAYGYNNEGKFAGITYPTTTTLGDSGPVTVPGPVYNYSYDTMMRPSGMTDRTNYAVVSNTQYGAANELLQITINGGTETRQYNSLYQLTGINGSGLNMTYAFPIGTNTGKISSQTDVLSGETVNYQYDSLNRLISASSGGWNQGYTYDGFGNLTARTGTNAISTPADPATNHLTGYSYDANGNLTLTGVAYDAENRLNQENAGGTRFFYDAQNKRIWEGDFRQQSYSCGDFCQTSGWVVNGESLFLYGVDGKLIGTYSPWIATDVYGHMQGMYFFQSGTRTYFGNRLVMLQNNGPQNLLAPGPDRVSSNGKFYPYGEVKVAPTYPQIGMFATYTRDATGLDYANQRYYSSQFGRFMSPDRYRASAGLGDPGSWNPYAYTRGDPINRRDPFGTCDQSADTSTSVTVCATADPVLYFPFMVLDGGPSDFYTNTAIQMENALSGLATTIANGIWAGTLDVLKSAANFISTDEDLWNIPDCQKDLSSIRPQHETSPAAGKGSPSLTDITSAASNVQFQNALTTTLPPIAGVPGPPPLAASVFLPGQLAGVFLPPGVHSSNVQYWVPGSTIFAPGSPGTLMTQPRLNGIVLHELLHNLGYDDIDVQLSLFGSLSPNTDNISIRLTQDCFK